MYKACMLKAKSLEGKVNFECLQLKDVFIEYHFSGFEEEYGGMDWVSLRLVFVQEGGQWYLVGLVNDRWTI